MIEAVGGGVPNPSETLATPTQRVRSGGSGALPEAPSPFEIAQQIQEVQNKNLKRALEAQTLVLDLLV